MSLSIKVGCLITIALLQSGLYAQVPVETDPEDAAIIALEAAVIEEAQNPLVTSLKIPPTIAENKQLSDLLFARTPAYIKFNGPGMSATISFRGSGAERTSVVWNGINIQNNMLGQFDFSLVTGGAFENVQVYAGGASAQYGNAAISGAVLLGNTPDFKPRFSLMLKQEYGSFQTYQSAGQLLFSNARFHTRTHYARIQSLNNYPFRDYAEVGAPVKYQANGAYVTHSLIHESAWKIRPNHQLGADFWFQEATRRIPLPLGVADFHPRQYDRAFRAVVKYTGEKGAHSWKIISGFFDEQLNYGDDHIESRSNLKTITIDATGKYKFKKINASLDYGADYQYLIPTLTDYENNAIQHRGSVRIGWNIVRHIHRFSLLARQQFISDFQTVPTFTVRYQAEKELPLQHSLMWNISAGNGYRVPTLNDRFWKPGGNPALVPEHSWSGDLTLQWKKKFRSSVKGQEVNHEISCKTVGFANYVSHYIQWRPTPFGYWAPINYKKVFITGAELYLSYQADFHRERHMNFDLFYAFTNARNLSDQYMGNYLIYTPAHQAGATFSGEIHRFGWALTGKFVGPTFTSEDNMYNLDAYAVLSLDLSYRLKTPFMDISFIGRTGNMTNTEYQTILNRPMPGFHWSAGLKISIHQFHIQQFKSRS